MITAKRYFLPLLLGGLVLGLAHLALKNNFFPDSVFKAEPADEALTTSSGLESKAPAEESPATGELSKQVRPRFEFTQTNPAFRFSAELPVNWRVEYVPEIQAVNVYDPAVAAETAREQSQIFIRFFEASDFLTLATVDILQRQAITVNSHPAVRYEIEKKPGVPNFSQQPVWRSQRHTLTDVRFSASNPSRFYVFASRPILSAEEFERFLRSLTFHNDVSSLVSPLDRPGQRISKKPFGLLITPATSPVQPERFSGYHTGVDLEVFPAEIDEPVTVRAFCGGPLLLKQTATGYGGVAVQICQLGDETLTALYGHLDIDSVKARLGDYIMPGSVIGNLGDDQSAKTDGERKHLHFALHRGSEAALAGYVQEKELLSAWLDPAGYIRK